jgi:hypothetical protein
VQAFYVSFTTLFPLQGLVNFLVFFHHTTKTFRSVRTHTVSSLICSEAERQAPVLPGRAIRVDPAMYGFGSSTVPLPPVTAR